MRNKNTFYPLGDFFFCRRRLATSRKRRTKIKFVYYCCHYRYLIKQEGELEENDEEERGKRLGEKKSCNKMAKDIKSRGNKCQNKINEKYFGNHSHAVLTCRNPTNPPKTLGPKWDQLMKITRTHSKRIHWNSAVLLLFCLVWRLQIENWEFIINFFPHSIFHFNVNQFGKFLND